MAEHPIYLSSQDECISKEYQDDLVRPEDRLLYRDSGLLLRRTRVHHEI